MPGELADQNVTSALSIEKAGRITGIRHAFGRSGRQHDGIEFPAECDGFLLQLFQC
jgi:hypothetical protein